MTTLDLNCWHCGTPLKGVPLPVGRREECPLCASSLHVCRMCDFYAPGASKQCTEPMAEEQPEKETANFCDYFQPKAGLAGGIDHEAANARAKLESVFGTTKPPSAVSGKSAHKAEAQSEAAKARHKLDKLFKDPGG